MLTDGCDPEIFEDIQWPETKPGHVATAPCPCAEKISQLAGSATRLCRGTYTTGAMWDSVIDVSLCATSMSENTRILCSIQAVSYFFIL